MIVGSSHAMSCQVHVVPRHPRACSAPRTDLSPLRPQRAAQSSSAPIYAVSKHPQPLPSPTIHTRINLPASYPVLSYPIPSYPIQVYRLACRPSRWSSPPLYSGLFNAAIDATTSAGARRCQVASVRFELAPTVTAKTWPFGRSVFKRAWNISRPVLGTAGRTTDNGFHLPSSVWSSPRQRTNSGGSPTCVPYSLMRRVAM